MKRIFSFCSLLAVGLFVGLALPSANAQIAYGVGGNIGNYAGPILSKNPGSGVGYTTGAGGAVTQATNRTTGVTINTVCGAITTNNTSLAAGAVATFTVTDSSVAVGDVIVVSKASGATNVDTIAIVSRVAAGAFDVTIKNTNASTAEVGSIVLNFAVVKAASS